MTKEQAIKKIQAIIDCDLRELNTMPQHEALQNEVEALDMAIEALEQPTSDDCVNRAEIFEIMGNLMSIPYDFDRQITEKDVSESMDEIKALPPVIPTQSLIPVSERLPEEETDVLICNANKEIAISRGSYSTEIENAFIWYTSGWRFGEVLAWQPLPKPYK